MNAPAKLSAFDWVPDFARGHVRDLRIRWACEEIGRPYTTVLLDATQPRGPEYTWWQPFGQVPAWQDSDLAIFESGAILLQLGSLEPRLLPIDPAARWRAISWLFAALNSIEPFLGTLVDLKLFHAEEPWSDAAFTTFRPQVEKRLAQLADALGDREWLAGPFSIADIAMVTVLQLVTAFGVLDGFPTLVAYVDRGLARPAHARALQAQLGDFQDRPDPR